MEAVTLKNVSTDALDIAYDEDGDLDGWPVVLLHGFPYDIHAYDDVTPRLISQGARGGYAIPPGILNATIKIRRHSTTSSLIVLPTAWE
jgi:hypothetical protein